MAQGKDEISPMAGLTIVAIVGITAFFLYRFGKPMWHWITYTLFVG